MLFVVGGAFYLVLEFGLKEALARPECLWCASNRFDTRLRSAGKWDNVERADFLSNITGYVSAPTYAMGMLCCCVLTGGGNVSVLTRWSIT